MGDTSPFRLRGLKGCWWEPRQYLPWPELLASDGYNFLLLCYTFSPETGLRWRRPLGPAEQDVIRRLRADCSAREIELCLALHPFIGGQSWAPEAAAVRFHPTAGRDWFLRYWRARRPGEELVPDRPLEYGLAADLELLLAKCRLVQGWGIRAFALCLDDIDPGQTLAGFSSVAQAQAWLVTRLWAGLRAVDPAARLFVVPTYYWTEGARAHAEYTAELARGLPEGVDLFWTGLVVRSHAITAEQAREAAALFGRRPVVWHNYASNDSFRFALQLPPTQPPAADLAGETAGLMVNPMRQVGLTRLHALVMGEYLSDPAGFRYEPALRRAARRLVGEVAAPLLMRVLAAWAAYPDPRSLPHDLTVGGRPLLDRLLAELNLSLAELDDTLPRLSPLLPDADTRQELAAASLRLRLLVDALELRRAEHDAGSTLAAERHRLQARLAGLDEETASDARAVLPRTPPPG
jgi:hypothetical protein